jgi:hypothetical protein
MNRIDIFMLMVMWLFVAMAVRYGGMAGMLVLVMAGSVTVSMLWGRGR